MLPCTNSNSNSNSRATYEAANKISTLSGGTISHDLDGNITSLTATGVPASTMTWDIRSKLKTLTTGSTAVTYIYNAAGSVRFRPKAQ